MSIFKEYWSRIRIRVEEPLDIAARRRLVRELIDRNVDIVYLSNWPAGTSQIEWQKALEWLDMPVYYDAAAKAVVDGKITISNKGIHTRRVV